MSLSSFRGGIQLWAGLTGLAVLLMLGATGAKGDVVYSDGTFQPQDWSATVFLEWGNGGHLDFALQEPSGGNPGEFREIGLTVFGTDSLNDYCAIRVVSQFLPAGYNPATQGPLESIDYTFDSKLILGHSAGQGTAPRGRGGR